MRKISILFLLAFVFACEAEGPNGPEQPDPATFDRQAMLLNWADNIIIPGLTAFSQETQKLKSAGITFSENPTQAHLESLRDSWKSAYLLWQKVAMFNIGKATELRYRDNLNIYPANVFEIEENINLGIYNLELPSQNDRQGFPALDYLLHGLADNDAQILEFYTSHSLANNYLTYLKDLLTRIDDLTLAVLADWTTEGFRESFIENKGSSANASVDLLVNDFVFYYEKNLRAGKIGIPAGVFSGNPLSTHVEAYYKQDFSKELFLQALQAVEDFFIGKAFASNAEGKSLNDYLDFLQTEKGGADLSKLIQDQFSSIRNQAAPLQNNFIQQIENDNTALLATYDQLQVNVVLLKVDMLQALNINVDYVDADGD